MCVVFVMTAHSDDKQTYTDVHTCMPHKHIHTYTHTPGHGLHTLGHLQPVVMKGL